MMVDRQFSNDTARENKEAGWVEILFFYFDRELHHKHFFRTAVDNWGMYRKGGSFLTRGGGPRFFNRPKSNDKRFSDMDFVSDRAQSLIQSTSVSEKMIIVDHAIPISVLHQIISDAKPKSPADLGEWLRRFYRLGVITYDEDAQLDRMGLNSSMPDGWSQETGDVFARYKAAGIGDSRPAIGP